MSSTAKQLTYKELKDSQDEQARAYLTGVLTAAGGERQRAAEIAGLNRTHLQALIKRYAIDVPYDPKARGRHRGRKKSDQPEDQPETPPPESPPSEAAETETSRDPVRF